MVPKTELVERICVNRSSFVKLLACIKASHGLERWTFYGSTGSLWTREISLDLWVCVKYILINLSSDYHYLMGLRRDTIPSPQSTGSDRTGYKSQHMGELSKIEGLRK